MYVRVNLPLVIVFPSISVILDVVYWISGVLEVGAEEASIDVVTALVVIHTGALGQNGSTIGLSKYFDALTVASHPFTSALADRVGYVPLPDVDTDSINASFIDCILDCHVLILAGLVNCAPLTTTIPTKIPKIATTMINSIKLKPLRFFLVLSISYLLNNKKCFIFFQIIAS